MFLIFEWLMYLIFTIPDIRQDSSDGSEEVCHISDKICIYNSVTTLIACFINRTLHYLCELLTLSRYVHPFLFYFLNCRFSCFQSPAIFSPYIDNVVNFCGFSFIESMLEPHAREAAGMSPVDVRNIFVILGAVYFVGMLLAGYVSEESNIFVKGNI